MVINVYASLMLIRLSVTNIHMLSFAIILAICTLLVNEKLPISDMVNFTFYYLFNPAVKSSVPLHVRRRKRMLETERKLECSNARATIIFRRITRCLCAV